MVMAGMAWRACRAMVASMGGRRGGSEKSERQLGMEGMLRREVGRRGGVVCRRRLG